MARGPEREIAWGCTTSAVGRPMICARTAVSSGSEPRVPLKVQTARPMASMARLGKREVPFKCRISDFGFCTLILQRRGGTVRRVTPELGGDGCRVLSGEEEREDVLQICRIIPPMWQ